MAPAVTGDKPTFTFSISITHEPITNTTPKVDICTNPNNHNCPWDNKLPKLTCGCGFNSGLGAAVNHNTNTANATPEVVRKEIDQPKSCATRGTAKITKPEPIKIDAP